MLALQRRQRILQLLERDKAVKVADLCQMLGVADETIRRDLRLLESEGLVERVHGGAVLADTIRVAHPFSQRVYQSTVEKGAIAREASSLILDGSTVILDNGTTTLEIARTMREKRGVTVVTTSPYIALELASAPGVQVMMTGGIVDKDSQALVGPDVERYLDRLKVDLAFVGASGVSRDRGFTASNVYDAQIKSAIIRSAERTYVVADASKVGVNSLIPFVSISQVSGLITDPSVRPDALEGLRAAGLRVLVPTEVQEGDGYEHT